MSLKKTLCIALIICNGYGKPLHLYNSFRMLWPILHKYILLLVVCVGIVFVIIRDKNKYPVDHISEEFIVQFKYLRYNFVAIVNSRFLFKTGVRTIKVSCLFDQNWSNFRSENLDIFWGKKYKTFQVVFFFFSHANYNANSWGSMRIKNPRRDFHILRYYRCWLLWQV